MVRRRQFFATAAAVPGLQAQVQRAQPASGAQEWSSRIPFIIRMPGGAGAGRRIQQPVSLVGLMPTLAELGGVRSEMTFDGKSVAPLV